MKRYRYMIVYTSYNPWWLHKRRRRHLGIQINGEQSQGLWNEDNIHGLEEYASHLRGPRELFHNCRSHSLGWPFLQSMTLIKFTRCGSSYLCNYQLHLNYQINTSVGQYYSEETVFACIWQLAAVFKYRSQHFLIKCIISKSTT